MENKHFFWSNSQCAKFLIGKLGGNDVVVSATDTVYGLMANSTQAGFDRLNAIKRERSDKPYLILISSLDKLNKFVDVRNLSPKVLNVINNCWPGPLTIIFKAREGIPSYLGSQNGTIAIRIPNHKWLLKLLEEFDGLFSTSANRSGQPVPHTISDISPEILQDVAAVIEDDADVASRDRKPSTLVDFSKDTGWEVVRAGAISKDEIERYYE